MQRLDHAPPPPEPRLREAGAHLLARGISGADLAELEEGWVALLDEQPDAAAAHRRGERLFALAARIIAADDPQLAVAGRLYANRDLWRRGLADLPVPDLAGLSGHKFGRALRPLTSLARLAARDLAHVEPEATPARAAALLSHRLFGTVTLPY